MTEHFIVRHYTEDEAPMFKGNGFDGTRVGDDREDAELLAAWINQRLDRMSSLETEAQRYHEALRGVICERSELQARIRELEAEMRSIAEYDCVNSHTNKCDGCASCDARSTLQREVSK